MIPPIQSQDCIASKPSTLKLPPGFENTATPTVETVKLSQLKKNIKSITPQQKKTKSAPIPKPSIKKSFDSWCEARKLETEKPIKINNKETLKKLISSINKTTHQKKNPEEVLKPISKFLIELETQLSELSAGQEPKIVKVLEFQKIAYHLRARIYYHQYDYQNAIREYKDIAKEYPEDPWAFIQLGCIYFDKEKFEKAKKLFAKALNLCYLNGRTCVTGHEICFSYIDACHSYLSKNRPLESVVAFDLSDPGSLYHFLLAHSYYRKGQYKEAKWHLNKYFETEKIASPPANFLKFCLALGEGKVKDALACLPFVGASFRKNLLNLSIKFKKAQQYENALAILDFLYKQLPTPNVLLQRARVYFDMKNHNLAQVDIDKLNACDQKYHPPLKPTVNKIKHVFLSRAIQTAQKKACHALAKVALENKNEFLLRAASEKFLKQIHPSEKDIDTILQLAMCLLTLKKSKNHLLASKLLFKLENAFPQKQLVENVITNLRKTISNLSDPSEKEKCFQLYFQVIASLKISDASMLISLLNMAEDEFKLPSFYDPTEPEKKPPVQNSETNFNLESSVGWANALKNLQNLLSILSQDKRLMNMEIPQHNASGPFIEIAHEVWQKITKEEKRRIPKNDLAFIYSTLASLLLTKHAESSEEILIEVAAHYIHAAQRQISQNRILILSACERLAKAALKNKNGFLLRAAGEQILMMLKQRTLLSKSESSVFNQLSNALLNISKDQCESKLEESIYHNLGSELSQTLRILDSRGRILQNLKSLLLKYLPDSRLTSMAIPETCNSSEFTRLILEVWGKISLENFSKSEIIFIYRTLTILFLENPSLDYLNLAYQNLQQEDSKDYIPIYLNTLHLSIKVAKELIRDLDKGTLLNEKVNLIKQIILNNFPVKNTHVYSKEILSIINDIFQTDLTLPPHEDIAQFLLLQLIKSHNQKLIFANENIAGQMCHLLEKLLKQFCTLPSWKNFFIEFFQLVPFYFPPQYLLQLYNCLGEQIKTTVKGISWTGNDDLKQVNTLQTMFIYLSLIPNREIFLSLITTLFNKALPYSGKAFEWHNVMKSVLDAAHQHNVFNTSEKGKSCLLLSESLYIQSLCKTLDKNLSPTVAFGRLKQMSTLINYENLSELRIFLNVIERFHHYLCCLLIYESEGKNSIAKDFVEWLGSALFNKDVAPKTTEILCEFSGKVLVPIPFYLKGLKVITSVIKEMFAENKMIRNFSYLQWIDLTKLQASVIPKESMAMQIQTKIASELQKIDCHIYPNLLHLLAFLYTDERIEKATSGLGLRNLQNFFIDYCAVLAKSKLMTYEIQNKQVVLFSSLTIATRKFGEFYSKSFNILKNRIGKTNLPREYILN